jgi:hypothetical protein
MLNCPHCDSFIIISKMNCHIFRHDVFIKNGKQIDPHSTKELLIYGCGKPFKEYRIL